MRAQDKGEHQGPADKPTAELIGENSPAPAPKFLSHKKKAVWTLAGISGAALITGGVFGLTALDEKQRNDDNPAEEFADRRDARALASYISFGAAGAAAVAAVVVWLVVDDKCDPNDDRASVTTDGASVILRF